MFSQHEKKSLKWDYKSLLKEYDDMNWVSPETISFFPNTSTSTGKYVIIEGEENLKDINSIHPFMLKKFLESNFPGFTELKKLKNGKCMFKTGTMAQANKFSGSLIDMYDLGKVRVNSMKNLNEVRGVIIGKELMHLTEDQIKQALVPHKVIEVRRIKRQLNGVLAESPVHVITFDQSDLPKEVKIVNFVYHPRLYIPSPYQCMKCLEHGHSAKFCKAPEVLCRLCSEKKAENHNCTEKSCKNCPTDNDHSPTSNECPVYQFEKIVQKMRVQKKISYQQAKHELLKMIESKMNSNEKSFSQALNLGEKENLMRQITEQEQQNKRDREVNEALKTLLTENECILEERKKLLERLKKQKEEMEAVEREIEKYGGKSIIIPPLPTMDGSMFDEKDFYMNEDELKALKGQARYRNFHENKNKKLRTETYQIEVQQTTNQSTQEGVNIDEYSIPDDDSYDMN